LRPVRRGKELNELEILLFLPRPGAVHNSGQSIARALKQLGSRRDGLAQRAAFLPHAAALSRVGAHGVPRRVPAASIVFLDLLVMSGEVVEQ
jgi:hypothetical protein